VLYFTHNSLSGEDLGALLEACESRQIRLRRLFLRSNEVKELGATHLAEKFGELEELDLRSNRVSANGIRRLCEAAAKKRGVRVLRLGYNESLGDVTMKATGGFATGTQALRQQSAAPALRDLICAGRIAVLDLPAAGLNTHDAVRCLTDGLRCRPSRSARGCALRTLGLASNKLDSDAAATLAQAITNCNSLRVLDLADNEVGDAGAEALSDAAVESGLVELLLPRNEISDVGARAIFFAAQKNAKVRYGCQGNVFSMVMRRRFRQLGDRVTLETASP
jgi:Ran GTPase-activating protein (RanGAP) involved in mRNA processing and transport